MSNDEEATVTGATNVVVTDDTLTVDLSDGRTIGHLSRKFQLRDRYVLDVGGDVERRLDRRLAIALAVGLDTLQNR